MSAENLDTERVITEVRGQPSLWDLSEILYKDRDAKLRAWTEVCRALFPGYDDLPDKEKQEIVKQVQLRWRTARDAYMKCKNSLKNVKSGSGGGKKSKYVYFEHMQFLDIKLIVDTIESINECQNTNETCSILPPSHSTHNQSQLPSTSRDAGNSSEITLTPPTISKPNQTTFQKNPKKPKNREDSEKKFF
ncbi:unnamed protein product [Parnassius apollo]|uniref:(apollo) hypothetical protein n=1 Tax=Parnassius apollo TaxID=110799 RepID=A0A8S3WN29_PARAO|nr:unnamed protein product [Parnassius apollo]